MIESRTRTDTRTPTAVITSLITAAIAPIALSGALLLSGCGGDSGGGRAEQMLSDAQQALRDARNLVLEANERLQEKEEALAVAKMEVENAREEVRTAKAQLDTVEKTVDLKATDGLLFRAIQRKLLDDERLADAIVSVHVDKGVVTLRGQVHSEDDKEAALEIARSVPGVASVHSALEVVPEKG